MNMQTVVLDTNALLMPFEVKLNIDIEVRNLIGECRFVVPGPIVGELKRLENKFSKVALSLARRYEILKTEKTGDEAVIEVALLTSGYVLTNDKELRSKLRKLKVPLIYLRSGTHLIVERF